MMAISNPDTSQKVPYLASALLGAIIFAAFFLDIDKASGADIESPEQLVEKLRLPDSLSPNEVYGEQLTIEGLVKTRDELRRHKEWVDNVVDEYKWLLTTDPEGVRQYNKLVETQKELSETLDHLEKLSQENGEFDKIQKLLDKLKDSTEPGRLNVIADSALEDLKISRLREVKENLLEMYRGAAQVAQVPDYGYVLVNGVPTRFNDIYGVRFANDDETQIPRRAARAFFEFKRVMLEATGQYPIIVEGHTGDLDRPTSGVHESKEHKIGTAADIVPRDFSMTDDKVYKILMRAKDNPYFRIKYEPGSPQEVQAFINSYSSQAVQDRHFASEDEARKWFQKQLGHYKYTTGRHFHVVALGGIGHDVDPRGPKMPIIASR